MATTTERGYGRAHQVERERWRPTVEAGQAWCTEPICLHDDRWIPPGTPWHLAHNREAGGYRGPAHERCNTSEGATFGNRRRGGRTEQYDADAPLNRWAL